MERKLTKDSVDGKGEVEEYLHDSRVPTMTEIAAALLFQETFLYFLTQRELLAGPACE